MPIQITHAHTIKAVTYKFFIVTFAIFRFVRSIKLLNLHVCCSHFFLLQKKKNNNCASIIHTRVPLLSTNCPLMFSQILYLNTKNVNNSTASKPHSLLNFQQTQDCIQRLVF